MLVYIKYYDIEVQFKCKGIQIKYKYLNLSNPNCINDKIS